MPWFIKMEGVDGEFSDADRFDFSQLTTEPTAPAGEVTHSEFAIVKLTDLESRAPARRHAMRLHRRAHLARALSLAAIAAVLTLFAVQQASAAMFGRGGGFSMSRGGFASQRMMAQPRMMQPRMMQPQHDAAARFDDAADDGWGIGVVDVGRQHRQVRQSRPKGWLRSRGHQSRRRRPQAAKRTHRRREAASG